MVRRTAEPLTPAQAKARLRRTCRRYDPQRWVQRHPWQALLVAAAAGLLRANIGPRR